MPRTPSDLEQHAVHALRLLAVDTVERAHSGHPGLPMGMADAAYTLFARHLRFDPTDPGWPGRDRFVLSAGHGSALLYGLLHLFGYDLPLEELQRFRQWGSRTPGHPERGCAPGVETTTGPLGQGLATALGMALAGRWLAARLDTADFQPAGWRVFCLVSDGDLMEGVAAEAASLAGHLKLGNLISLYDDNGITIEGPTSLAFSEDVPKRFAALGWHVQRVGGLDRPAIHRALGRAASLRDRPSLICVKSHIGYGSPARQDTAAAHGSPLGPDEVRATRRALGWPEEPAFLVPEEVRAVFARRIAQARRARRRWNEGYRAWREREPERAALWDRLSTGETPADLFEQLRAAAGESGAASRSISGRVIQRAASLVPGLLGGSADLAPSNDTTIRDGGSLGPGAPGGRNLHFGVREHAMGAALNGLALSGLVPFGGTFLVFSDYMRPAVRLAAMMELGVIYLWTHDSLLLGEDGPTHQPIEQLAALRAIPGLLVYRPADALEVAAGWTLALGRRRAPTALVLSRQKLPAFDRAAGADPQDALRGAALVVAGDPAHRAALIATGSEVAPAAVAAHALGLRLVSMPSRELFLQQPAEWRARLLPAGYRLAVVEASRDPGWHELLGADGLLVGLLGYGASAPADELVRRFGLDAASLTTRLGAWLSQGSDGKSVKCRCLTP